MKKPLHFTDSNFATEVLESEEAVLVDFWADWCGPCHALAPSIEELAGQYEGSVRVGKLDVDENPVTATAYQIRSIPSVLVFKNGNVVANLIGAQPKQAYEEALKQADSQEAA